VKQKVPPSKTHYPTPVVPEALQAPDEEKIALIADRFREIMQILGLNLADPSLEKTPYRVARMYVEEIFSGLKEENFPAMSYISETLYDPHKSHIVVVKVSFTSFCEHHFVPFHGKAFVSYLPQDRLLGLSKIPRIVRYFAKRPQVQERLTAQIADAIALLLNHNNVAVSLIAEHFCVIARGVEDEHSHTVTNVLRGQFHSDEKLRREFFEGVNRPYE
jgi:GTP cyclohydrolase I